MIYVIRCLVSLLFMFVSMWGFPEPLAIFSASFFGLLTILAIYFLEIDRREKGR